MTLRMMAGAGMTVMVMIAAGAVMLPRGAAAASADGAAAAREFTIDPVHSCVVFKVRHMNIGMFYGRFNDVSGSYAIHADDPSKSSMTVTIKAASVDTNNGKRDDHLKSNDFFSAEQFPEITFKATKFEKSATGEMTVTGDLTLRGTTRPVTAPLTFIGSAEGKGGVKSGYETTFTIRRSDFGISYMPQGLGDEVTVMFAFEGGAKG